MWASGRTSWSTRSTASTAQRPALTPPAATCGGRCAPRWRNFLGVSIAVNLSWASANERGVGECERRSAARRTFHSPQRFSTETLTLRGGKHVVRRRSKIYVVRRGLNPRRTTRIFFPQRFSTECLKFSSIGGSNSRLDSVGCYADVVPRTKPRTLGVAFDDIYLLQLRSAAPQWRVERPRLSHRIVVGLLHSEVGLQGVIRYHPASAERRGREKRKNMAVLETNDWDDSVTSCLCGKKGERTEKRSLC